MDNKIDDLLNGDKWWWPVEYEHTYDLGGCPLWSVKYYKPMEEEKMNLSKKYSFNAKDENTRRAIDLGAMTEDGLLTCEGKDLLLNLLIQDEDVRAKFDKALKELDGEE